MKLSEILFSIMFVIINFTLKLLKNHTKNDFTGILYIYGVCGSREKINIALIISEVILDI